MSQFDKVIEVQVSVNKVCFYTSEVEEAFKTSSTAVFAVHCDGQHTVVSFADDENPPPGVLVGFVKKP